MSFDLKRSPSPSKYREVGLREYADSSASSSPVAGAAKSSATLVVETDFETELSMALRSSRRVLTDHLYQEESELDAFSISESEDDEEPALDTPQLELRSIDLELSPSTTTSSLSSQLSGAEDEGGVFSVIDDAPRTTIPQRNKRNAT